MSLISHPEMFIDEWLEFLPISAKRNVGLDQTPTKLNYHFPDLQLGIFVPKLDKPITIAELHKAVKFIETFRLKKLIVVAREVSLYVEDSLKRLGYPIKIIEDFALSEIAIELTNSRPTNNYS